MPTEGRESTRVRQELKGIPPKKFENKQMEQMIAESLRETSIRNGKENVTKDCTSCTWFFTKDYQIKLSRRHRDY
jgi:hypothetical protein